MSTENIPESQALDRRAERAAALANTERAFTPAQIDVIKATVAKDATNEELQLFLTVAQRTGYDPFLKQIHFVKRWDSDSGKMIGAIQVGIDGFRVSSQRSGRDRGMIGPLFCGKDGKWTELWLDEANPAAAKVGIRVEGYPEPVWAIARWVAYAQKKKDGGYTKRWATAGPEMLAKCAEALCRRICFPNDLSGLYVDEELPEVSAEPVTQESNTTKHLRRDKKVREKAAESLATVLEEAGDAPTETGAGTDAAPDEPERGPYGPPDDDDPRSPEDKGEVLANSGTTLDDVVIAMIALRKAAEKDKRKFFEIKTNEKTGSARYALIDGELLTAAGQLERGVPKPCWLDNLRPASDKWLALCVAIVKTGQQYNLEIVR